MIELAGGKYVFENLGDPDSRRSTVNLQLEDFYDGAQDADFLVYNTTIDRQDVYKRQDRDRAEGRSVVRSAGYDIVEETKRLQEIYVSLIEK